MPPKKKREKKKPLSVKERLALRFKELQLKKMEKQIELLDAKKVRASQPKNIGRSVKSTSQYQTPPGTVNVPMSSLLRPSPVPTTNFVSQSAPMQPSELVKSDRAVATQIEMYLNNRMAEQEQRLMQQFGDEKLRKNTTPEPRQEIGAYHLSVDGAGNIVKETPVKESSNAHMKLPIRRDVQVMPVSFEQPVEASPIATPIKGGYDMLVETGPVNNIELQQLKEELESYHERIMKAYPHSRIERPSVYQLSTINENKRRLKETQRRWRVKFPNAFT